MNGKHLPLLALAFLLACGSKKETPASIAKEWCELNGKVFRASGDAEKRAAKEAREKFEKGIEEKYKNDEKFMKEVEAEVNKCEDASEGR